MRASSPPEAKRRASRGEQMILFRIGGQLFAISSSAVQEIRSADNIVSVRMDLEHSALRKVRCALHRGKRTVYVVHGGIHLGLPDTGAGLVFLLRNRRAALLVDTIEQMVQVTRLHAVPQAFCHEERTWYRGFITLENTVIPVINPDGLLQQEELALLDAARGITTAGTQESQGPKQLSA